MADVKVKTLKGFNNQGVYAKRGSTITVSVERAKELALLGLTEEPKVEKARAEPQNKMASKPANKATGPTADQAAADKAAADKAAADQAAADKPAAGKAAK